MERQDKRKPLTSEMKGSLITLYKTGHSLSQIADKLGCHVSDMLVVSIDINTQKLVGTRSDFIIRLLILLTEKYSFALGQPLFGYWKFRCVL